MRRILSAAMTLAIVVPMLRADDDKKEEPKTPEEQFKALQMDLGKERAAIMRAVNDADKDKQEELFYSKMGDLMVVEMPKFVAFAKANAKTDAGFNALIFVVRNTAGDFPNKDVAAKLGTVGDDSAKLLLEQYEDNIVARPAIMEVPGESGIKVLSALREKHTSGEKNVRITASLANLLKMSTERADNDAKAVKAAAQAKQAESLYADVISKGAEIESVSKVVSAAKASLAELQTLGIGKTMPELESKDLEDNTVKLSDLRGKVVVLDVWATWCGPCKAMIPHERELVAKMSGKPFALVSISCDEEKETLTKFLENEKMPWTHWWDGKKGPVIKALNLKYFPTIYVIDAKGVIRYRGARGPAMDAAVEKLLKEMPVS